MSDPNSGCGALRRRRSAPSSITPFNVRKTAALAGDAKTDLSGFSASSPMTPTGIVPTISSQPSRALGSSEASHGHVVLLAWSRDSGTLSGAIRFWI